MGVQVIDLASEFLVSLLVKHKRLVVTQSNPLYW